jgi:hypothetical protein
MQFKDEKAEERWNEYVAVNKDDYSKACVDYARRWAELMESKGCDKLEEIADKTSHEADTEGITGFMYGAAVSMLANVWKWGDRLREWHNLDVQIGDEGVAANKAKKVLNPALLSIGRKGG